MKNELKLRIIERSITGLNETEFALNTCQTQNL